jgi:hypothetical protein
MRVVIEKAYPLSLIPRDKRAERDVRGGGSEGGAVITGLKLNRPCDGS